MRMGPQRADGTYLNVDDTRPQFDSSPTVTNEQFLSPVVTLHELSHHVPAAALKEYQRATKAARKGEDASAIPYFQRAIAADHEFSAAINDLGTAYFRLNRMDLAVEEFTAAIAVDPHASGPQLNLAVAYINQQLFPDAERTARRAIDLERTGCYGRLLLGVALVLQGNFTAEAERNLATAAGEYVIAKFWLGIGSAVRGDIASATDHLRSYVAQAHVQDPNFVTRLLTQVEGTRQGR